MGLWKDSYRALGFKAHAAASLPRRDEGFKVCRLEDTAVGCQGLGGGMTG